ncbi:MAG: hypothetical protein E6G38_09340 [Actinobacteria bacterium]|nr:MAG: hypothetical protein E6G38_09340 [Actinomycetota bacterium]TML93062.1 MAG: hypothetical protein E6G03_16035 [Actinomycetota bacterium]
MRAPAAPVNNPLSLELVGTCSDGSAYDAFSPAGGHAVIDTLSHSVQVTEQLSVSDPLNEIGGSFSVTGTNYAALSAAGLLTHCIGTVVGTQSVTFTAEVLKTPTPK